VLTRPLSNIVLKIRWQQHIPWSNQVKTSHFKETQSLL